MESSNRSLSKKEIYRSKGVYTVLKTKLIIVAVIAVMMGIGNLLPISNIHADTLGTQEIKFNIKIDESLQKKYKHTVTVPDEEVNKVAKNGTLVIEILSEDDNKVFLDGKQMQYLIAQNATIQLKKDDIILSIPTVNLSGKHDLVLTVERLDEDIDTLPATNVAVGAIYNITLKWGDRLLSLFEHDITISFSVQGHDNPEELQIYYWNEETGQWELVGGEYEDGYVHVKTDHFSVFALFHPIELAEQIKKDSDNGKEKESNDEKSSLMDDSTKNKENESFITKEQEGQRVPRTATDTYNFIFMGLSFFLIGVLLYFFYYRFNEKRGS